MWALKIPRESSNRGAFTLLCVLSIGALTGPHSEYQIKISSHFLQWEEERKEPLWNTSEHSVLLSKTYSQEKLFYWTLACWGFIRLSTGGRGWGRYPTLVSSRFPHEGKELANSNLLSLPHRGREIHNSSLPSYPSYLRERGNAEKSTGDVHSLGA